MSLPQAQAESFIILKKTIKVAKTQEDRSRIKTTKLPHTTKVSGEDVSKKKRVLWSYGYIGSRIPSMIWAVVALI